MNGKMPVSRYYVGWDVGGWNCDRNPNSRDAVIILNPHQQIMGTPWRGNLRPHINEAYSAASWLDALFELCQIENRNEQTHITLAIDTPLGFARAFVSLITEGRYCTTALDASNSNPYLFRQTERFLAQHGLSPLSAVKDMIGSQSTKGMHVLAKFAPSIESCGVWTDHASMTAIEAYPAASKNSRTMARLRTEYNALAHNDLDDALTCALIAYLFAEDHERLIAPPADVPTSEGWIWVPGDIVSPRGKTNRRTPTTSGGS